MTSHIFWKIVQIVISFDIELLRQGSEIKMAPGLVVEIEISRVYQGIHGDH